MATQKASQLQTHTKKKKFKEKVQCSNPKCRVKERKKCHNLAKNVTTPEKQKNKRRNFNFLRNVGTLQRAQLGACVTCHHSDGAVVSAHPPEHDSEDFHAIFASTLNSTPLPDPYPVYNKLSWRDITEGCVLRTLYKNFQRPGGTARKLRWLCARAAITVCWLQPGSK